MVKLIKYKKQIRKLKEEGIYFFGDRKEYFGKVNKADVIKCMFINAFGYYRNNDGSWMCFITDNNQGYVISQKVISSEEECIKYLIKWYKPHRESQSGERWEYQNNSVY